MICELDYGSNNDQILVELDSGYDYGDVDDADGIENTTQANEGNIDDSACKGLEVDTNSGDTSVGIPIYLVGVNNSWVEDGTKAELDGNSLAEYCLLIKAKSSFIVENFAFHLATGNGVGWSNDGHCYHWMMKNCDSYNNLNHGWGAITGYVLYYGIFVRCRAWSNSGDGWTNDLAFSRFVCCTAHGNSGIGYYANTGNIYHACLSYDNGGTAGFYLALATAAFQCVSDGDERGLYVANGHALAVGCRFTNSAKDPDPADVAVNTAYLLDLWNYAPLDNSGSDYLIDSDFEGTSTRLTSGEVGYEDAANDKFGLRLGAAGFRTEVDMLGANYARFNRGLPNVIIPWLREEQ